jgi:hypothetical protein
MRIPVFAIGADPAIDTPFIRKSVSYCKTEVAARRAEYLDPEDIANGIRLVTHTSIPQSETRGSREQRGCLTSYEAQLNAEYFGSDTRSIGKLSAHYERALESHILAGRKGLPRKCATIAARVKTIMSQPSFA